MRAHIAPAARPLLGTLRVPGDKSVSHRAVLFGAMAEGTTEVTGVLDSADVRSTVGAVTALGADVALARSDDGALAGTITGWGAAGPVSPVEPVDCGNSGTTARLLLGVLAGWPVVVTLFGDESLSARPMGRVVGPLAEMGANFTTRDGCLPVTVEGSDSLRPLSYDSPVASAQVKSAILLAGVRASGRTSVREPAPSRDHTERLLPDFGVKVERDEPLREAALTGPAVLSAARIDVPADPSSAAFPIVAALIVEGSDVTMEGVGLNPTRTGFLRVLSRMGAKLAVEIDPGSGSERSGSIQVRHTPGLVGTVVEPGEVPSLIDEVPVLAVAAALASGTTRFEGVGELRVKESDRLTAVADGLRSLGVAVTVSGDVLEIHGTSGRPLVPGAGTVLDSKGDHRLAMSWAVAGLACSEPISIDRFEALDVSYPGFREDMSSLGAW